jgi:hypothetical protein
VQNRIVFVVLTLGQSNLVLDRMPCLSSLCGKIFVGTAVFSHFAFTD